VNVVNVSISKNSQEKNESHDQETENV